MWYICDFTVSENIEVFSSKYTRVIPPVNLSPLHRIYFFQNPTMRRRSELMRLLYHFFCVGGLDMAVEGPSKAEISCIDNKDGTCTVTYLPTLPGDYNILVRYNDKHIAGSPFTARITGENLRCVWSDAVPLFTFAPFRRNSNNQPNKSLINALLIYVSLGLFAEDNKRRSHVKLGSAADFALDITETDLSQLTASIKAPSGRDEPCLLKRQPNNHIGMGSSFFL